MKELPSARTQEWQDVLEVRGGTCRCSKRRGVERASPRGEESDARETGSDLEASRVEVLVRQAIACEVEDWSHEERRESRPTGRAGGSARRHVERDYHNRLRRNVSGVRRGHSAEAHAVAREADQPHKALFVEDDQSAVRPGVESLESLRSEHVLSDGHWRLVDERERQLVGMRAVRDCRDGAAEAVALYEKEHLHTGVLERLLSIRNRYVRRERLRSAQHHVGNSGFGLRHHLGAMVMAINPLLPELLRAVAPRPMESDGGNDEPYAGQFSAGRDLRQDDDSDSRGSRRQK